MYTAHELLNNRVNYLDKLYGVKRYLNKVLEANLFKKGVDVLDTIRKNIKTNAITVCDTAIIS
jgi:hypothetical protein